MVMANFENRHEEDKLRALRKCTVELCSKMNPDAMKVALYAKQMLTSDDVDRLGLPIMTKKDKIMFILTKIPSKGLRAFDYFIEALESTSDENPAHNELVDQLLNELHS